MAKAEHLSNVPHSPMTLFAAPMLVLYELSIWISRFAGKGAAEPPVVIPAGPAGG